MENRLLKLAREPLLQFWLIGACIYGLYGWYGEPQDDAMDKSVIVDLARVEGFAGQWTKRWNRPPTRQELDGVIDSFVREEILFRQAVAMGLDQDDPITRRRMAQKLEFLTSDVALFKEPTTAELEEFFESHLARYRGDDLITFSQFYFDPDRREESTLDDAAEALARLELAGDPASAATAAGDRSIVQRDFQEASQLDVQRQLGSGFADAVMKLEPRQWHGPVLSGFGVHLVYVHESQQAPTPTFDDVEPRVLEDWQEDQQDKFNEEFYQSLKNRYDIVIAEPPAEILLQTPEQTRDDNTDASAESSMGDSTP